MIQNIDINTFNKVCEIKINTVVEGFNKYNNKTISFDNLETMNSYFEDLFNNNNQTVYIDFYSNKLDENNFSCILKELSQDNKVYIEMMKEYIGSNKIYFKVDSKNLLYALIEMNFKELFFTNFYFHLINKTVWPSFNGDIIEFTK